MEVNLAACLFGLYFALLPLWSQLQAEAFKFGSVTTDKVAPVAKFKIASSKHKNASPCRFTFEFEVEFANFGSKFSASKMRRFWFYALKRVNFIKKEKNEKNIYPSSGFVVRFHP